MRKQVLLGSAAALAVLAPTAASAWTRGFVVDFYEPAFYYGGPALTTEAPGSDCPKGTVPAPPVLHKLGEGPRVREVPEQRTFAPGIDLFLNPFTAPDPGQQQVTGKIAIGFDLDNNPKTGGF